MIWLGAACAAASNATTTSDAFHSDDATAYHDAMAMHDATPVHDAMPAHDASIHDAAEPKDAAPIEDAPGSGGELCADNTGCTDPGTCCYCFTCTLGTGVGSHLCFPSS
jgi:hypothetical protein